MALTKLDPTVIGQDSTGAGKITSAGGSVSIDSSGNVRIANSTANSVTVAANGFVGINNATPGWMLTVAGTGHFGSELSESNDGETLMVSTTGTTRLVLNTTTSGSSKRTYLDNAADGSFTINIDPGSNASNPALALKQRGTTKMGFNSSGLLYTNGSNPILTRQDQTVVGAATNSIVQEQWHTAFNATTSGNVWCRCAYLASRHPVLVNISTLGGNYTPGSTTFICNNSWDSTSFNVVTLAKNGAQYASYVRFNTNNNGGDYYLEVLFNVSSLQTSTCFDITVLPLSGLQSIGGTYGVGSYGTSAANLTYVGSSIAL